MKTPILVNRHEFMSWAEGTLLSFKNGVGFAVNEILCETAEAALNEGETVYLTNKHGKIISKMAVEGDVIVESNIEDADRIAVMKAMFE